MISEPFTSSRQRQRITPQRRIILEEIKKVDTHPTADEVYEMVRKRMPHISLGTVYRNLEILSQWGLIQRIGPVSGQMRFDGNTKTHYHIRCVYCGSIEDAPIEPLNTFENAIGDQSSYTIIGHTVEFLGICPRCQNKNTLSFK